jgi:hypothetical protein
MALYATWNPADKDDITLSNGDLTATSTVGGEWDSVRSTLSVSNGKWYWEITVNDPDALNWFMIGVASASASLTQYCGQNQESWGYGAHGGLKRHGGSSWGYCDTYKKDDVIMAALDMDNNKIWWGKNGTWCASGDPAAGTNAAFDDLDKSPLYAMTSNYELNSQCTANFGASSFQYTVPDGFSAGLFSGEPVTFTFTNPSPVHLSTVYGNNQTLQLTVTISGEDPSYIYDATFYNATTSGVIGSTVSGTNSGESVSTNWSSVDSGDYSWYLYVTSSGENDTSSTCEFTKKYKCAGYVEIDGTRASGIPVRLYLRSGGELIGSTTSAGISGTFEVDTIYNENHYAIAIHPTDSGTNALIMDWLTP